MRKSLIERMEARYRRRGYHTHGLLPGRTGAPEGWRGPLPDLLCQKGRRRVASLVRSEAQLRDPRELENVQAMLANRGASVRLFVFSPRSLRAAKAFRRRIRGWLRRRRVHIFRVMRLQRLQKDGGRHSHWLFIGFQWKVTLYGVCLGIVLAVILYLFPSLVTENSLEYLQEY